MHTQWTTCKTCPASPWHLVSTNPISTGIHCTTTYGSRCTENGTSGEQSATCWDCLKSDSTCQMKCCCSICYVVSDIWYNYKYFINLNSYFVALHSLMSYGITFWWNSAIKDTCEQWQPLNERSLVWKLLASWTFCHLPESTLSQYYHRLWTWANFEQIPIQAT